MSFELRRELRRAGTLLAAVLLAVFAVIGFAGSWTVAHSAAGVRLIMVEEPGCRFCRKWNAEIAPGYRKSAEGRFAPLKRVRRGAPELKALAPIVFTPTFVVVRRGEELGRITGYPGADYFYGELRPLLAAAGFWSGL